ncbi:MAG: hypothetical protein QOJ56_3450 [Mycobacterium sp.]|jgi:hypothetical protein|nr:hypothetical protein [Mycobacterium sp.]
MNSGKAVNLRVRPIQSVDLCYPTDGIIGYLPDTLLGQTVQGFDLLNDLYMHLSDLSQKIIKGHVVGTSPDLLHYGSKNLENRLTGYILCALRAEPLKTDLDSAIGWRQNTYLTTYSPDVLTEARQVFYDNPADQSSVVWRLLADLEADSLTLNKGLHDAYKREGLLGQVIQYAESDTTSNSQVDSRDGTATSMGGSHTASQGFEFRYPSAENNIRYRRARSSLRPELLNAIRMREMFRYASTIFPNELAAIDRQIKKLQVAYLDTLLISPFDGLVTGVFRNEGDYVSAGQPVIRVENDTTVYLVGTIKYRGLLRVNSHVTVSTTLFDTEGAQTTAIDGTVSAVRGHNSVDEQWDVLIKCSNRTPAGEPILPLNYNFDFDSTIVNVTNV